MAVCLNGIESKVMGCIAFLPADLPPTKQPILRAYVYKKCKMAPQEEKERIMKEEAVVGYKLAFPERQFCFQTDKAGGNLTVWCKEEGHDECYREKSYGKKDVMQWLTKVFDVVLDLRQREENMILRLFLKQVEKLDEDIPFQTTYALCHKVTDGERPRGAEAACVIELEIEDRLLRKIAKAIGGNNSKVMDVGIALGIRVPKIKEYQESNKSGADVSSDGTFDMLFDWRSSCPESDQRRFLREALKEANLTAIASEKL